MRHALIAFAVPLVYGASIANAQGVPVTLAQANAEASQFPRAGSASVGQPYFAKPSAGTSDRRCVASRSEPDPHATGSLRSGEMIVRGGWNDPTLPAGKEHNFLWLPLHGSELQGTPLVLRADRVGAPGDSLRLTVPRPAYTPAPVSRRTYGYPSLVDFPTPGQWIVLATAGDDWGCFVLDVGERSAGTK